MLRRTSSSSSLYGVLCCHTWRPFLIALQTFRTEIITELIPKKSKSVSVHSAYIAHREVREGLGERPVLMPHDGDSEDDLSDE